MKMFLATILFAPFMALAQSHLPQLSCELSKTSVFKADNVLEIKMKGKFPASDMSAAEIQYQDQQSSTEKSIPVNVSRRGKSRGWRCDFKPIRITWGEDQKNLSKNTIFENIKGRDMKLTTHCSYTKGTIEENKDINEVVIKEYMIYKILKAFGLPAFDVRLTKVQYIAEDNTPQVEGMGFFIESSAQFADRCGLTHVQQNEVFNTVSDMNKQIYILYLYARLISDAKDFMVDAGHNSELFFKANKEQVESKVVQTLVAYDFNDSGQVNSGIAPYWNFSPAWDNWFDLFKQGPFTRDGYLSANLTSEEKAAWTEGLVEQAKLLITKKSAVIKVIEESPLQSDSKKQFIEHVKMLVKQFKKMVKNPQSLEDQTKN